jgi:hypothetical protein
MINALPGISSVNTVLQATIEEAVFSVDPNVVPIRWLDSDHVTQTGRHTFGQRMLLLSHEYIQLILHIN